MAIADIPSGSSSRGRLRLILAMLAAVALVTALGIWDQQREAAASMQEFLREHATLAKVIAMDAGARLATRAGALDRDTIPAAEVLAGGRYIEDDGNVLLLLARPSRPGFSTADGRVLSSQRIERALRDGLTSASIPRDEAADLGLPRRIAVAGIARIDAAPGGAWGVVVVESAQRERDRERRAHYRLGLGVVLAAGLVLGFGGIALQRQRKELELARALAVREVERDRDEQLARAERMATLAALSTGIAHEIATPLGVIAGRAEQLHRRLAESERDRRAVDAIVEQVDRIQRVMRGVLGIARGEAPALERVAPSSLVRTAADLVRHRFAKAGVELTIEEGRDVAPIACDPQLVEQALANLMLNACDACSAGGKVCVSVEERSGKAAFRVRDDGCGISTSAADRAIEPFFTTKTEGRGTGLGLAIVHEIVKHHGGALVIGPGDAGVGTVAAIELPIAHG